MATSVAPEAREAGAAPVPAAREAGAAPAAPAAPAPAAPAPDPGSSVKIAATALPGDTSAPRGGETADDFKERVRVEARARAMQLVTGMPGAPGEPALSEAERAAAVADIDRRAADPAGALMADAAARAAAGEPPPVDPAAPPVDAPPVDPAAAPPVDPAAAPPIDPVAPVVDPVVDPALEAPAGVQIEIPVTGQDDPFVLEVPDEGTAEIINDLKRRAVRGDQARSIRAEATRIRDETDEFKFVVDLDPAGVLQESVTDPRDQAHLAKFLISRPGILQNPEVRQFLEDALEDTPERARERGELMELERLKRRDAVSDQVALRRSVRQEKRDIASTIHQSIESLAPDNLSSDALDLLYSDVSADVAAARERAPGGRFDRRHIPGIIQRRFKLLSIAPRGTAPAAPVAPAAPAAARPSAPAAAPRPATAPAVAVAAKTAVQLREAARARQDAATASPGQGSEVSRIPAPPAYDPAQPGDAIQQRVAWARKVMVPSMSKRPV